MTKCKYYYFSYVVFWLDIYNENVKIGSCSYKYKKVQKKNTESLPREREKKMYDRIKEMTKSIIANK